MKKMFTFLGVFGLFLLCSWPAAAQEVYNLKMQSYHPPMLTGYLENYAKDVEIATNGRVKIQIFPGGELVSTVDVLKAVASGTLDMAHGSGNFYTELTIGNIEGGLPMSWTTPEETHLIFDVLGMKAILEGEYAKHGVVHLASLWSVPYQILTKTPINNLDDLRKIKLRSANPAAKVLEAVGVNTVNLPPEDLYLALTTGQIDGVLWGAAYEYTVNKFVEAAQYLLETPMLSPWSDHIIINKELYESMPADIQAILKLATDKIRWYYYLMCISNYEAVKDTAFKGVTVLPEEDIKTLTEASIAIWDEEAARSPENAAAIKIIKDVAKGSGRL